ncbi:hypothetical protein BpHYR1_021149 [Brachionus plicatilis]|uniref:RNA-directed DNA polymerase from mobile element jockey-like n=1 Tax=Brachionus plicatilis TaxID=10195 RepID=A0A3M7PLY4_BRAPC|nr:hypothetical protein BpHYR1_021149 [Brachionus plicatilis]
MHTIKKSLIKLCNKLQIDNNNFKTKENRIKEIRNLNSIFTRKKLIFNAIFYFKIITKLKNTTSFLTCFTRLKVTNGY